MTSRPVATSSPSTVTSALTAAACGAIRCGAGISSTKTSGRNRAPRNCETASANSAGGASTCLRAPMLGSLRPITHRRLSRRAGNTPRPGDRAARTAWDHRCVPSTSLDRSPYLLAARGEPVPHTPVWFMRQAGRALPEYRKVREGVAMLESCMRPDLVVEITMQPVRRYGVDAAIFFSDIVLPLKAAGVDLDIKPGVGPVVAQPVTTIADVDAIPVLTPDHVPFVTESVRTLVGELGGTPLIGFAGAPFTVASYLVEGGPSKEHARTKAMMFGAPDVWTALMDKISGIAAAYLEVQVEAGASAVQLFDSWAGALTPADYRRYVMPYSSQVLAAAGGPRGPRNPLGGRPRE